jgi:hypothetical protein
VKEKNKGIEKGNTEREKGEEELVIEKRRSKENKKNEGEDDKLEW